MAGAAAQSPAVCRAAERAPCCPGAAERQEQDQPVVAGFREGSGTTASDSSGNGNPATLTSASLWTTDGKYGTALLLGGGNDGARAPASVSLNVSSGLTLEAWINPSSIANYPKVIVREGIGGLPYSLGMAWGLAVLRAAWVLGVYRRDQVPDIL